ncbi:hypothetical protein [Dactylosporangium sp. CA-092794]|uniref:hypothetical protein n=1 Tax=Dactylosporangium sp. CA-092794 TaxID=3239929 RepID=UPI003D949A4F
MIAGYATVDDDPGSLRPIRWDTNGTIAVLTSPTGGTAQPIAVNNHGTILGVSSGSPVLWDARGHLTELRTPGFPETINDDGVIVGYRNRLAPPTSDLQAMRWDTSRHAFALPYPPGYTSARAQFLNDHGMIAGYGHKPYDQDHAILWRTQ